MRRHLGSTTREFWIQKVDECAKHRPIRKANIVAGHYFRGWCDTRRQLGQSCSICSSGKPRHSSVSHWHIFITTAWSRAPFSKSPGVAWWSELFRQSEFGKSEDHHGRCKELQVPERWPCSAAFQSLKAANIHSHGVVPGWPNKHLQSFETSNCTQDSLLIWPMPLQYSSRPGGTLYTYVQTTYCQS